MTLKSDEIEWWTTLEISLLSLLASAIAFSSAITDIAVNWQKNITQHPYWGKIFQFWNDYAYISVHSLDNNNPLFKHKQF